MQTVKKFALIVDERNHQEEDHWGILFYRLGIRPDANICVKSAKMALDILAKKNRPEGPQIGAIVVWDDPPTSCGMDMFVQLANSEHEKDVVFILLSPNHQVDFGKLVSMKNYITFKIINRWKTPEQQQLLAMTLARDCQIG